VAAEAAAAEVPHLAEPPALPVEPGVSLSLEQIYAAASVPSCAYPAERLLRLLEGLKAMDEGLRRQTIQAIDSADDSWTIEDPKRDAAAKVAALERHAASLRAGLAQAEKDTQERLQALIQRQEGTVAEIRRQIADLEGLLAREIARGAQEQAALDAALQSQREAANHEIGNLSRAAAALTGLIAQFAIPVTK
jgi:chromosome segregation ATPase